MNGSAFRRRVRRTGLYRPTTEPSADFGRNLDDQPPDLPVDKIVSRYTILYGRRRFILMVLTGFAWQWLFKMLIIQRFIFTTESDILGFIIPGLIANEMERQRILPTLLTLLIISVMVRMT